MNEIAPISQDSDTALSVSSTSTTSGSLLNAIVELAKDRSIDKEMLAFLMDRQERMEDRQAEAEFNAAMSEAQGQMAAVVRDRVNDQTKSMYATLYAVNAAIRPVYVKHGFSLSFGTDTAEGNNIRIVCDVSRGRHTKRYFMDAPPDTLGPKGAPVKTVLHGIGSTMTYLRNKLTCGIFNIVLRNEDDDGVRGGMKFVTIDQAEEIEKLIIETKANRDRFMQHFQIANMLNLEEKEFVKAKNMLLSKKKEA